MVLTVVSAVAASGLMVPALADAASRSEAPGMPPYHELLGASFFECEMRPWKETLLVAL